MNILHGLFRARQESACPADDPEIGVDASDRLEASPDRSGLLPALRASLNAKLERLLRRPIIARIAEPACEPQEHVDDGDLPDVFEVLQKAAHTAAPARGVASRRADLWREDPRDGLITVSIELDYADLWRGCEREILEAVSGTVEQHVTFLTDEQKLLLERSPREFLALEPRPESVELLAFQTQMVGGGQRVVALTVAAAPESPRNIHHLAIVPNLVQLERQLAALCHIEGAADDGAIAPLRVLLGLSDASSLRPPAAVVGDLHTSATDRRLDEYQTECVHKALTTPHFAVIKGPPGSGKTTVITSIIRRALERGERVLVVSPTHVAVDNVVEKLAPQLDTKDRDELEARSLPVRYAARQKKLSQSALAYWIGPKNERRGATIAGRVQQCLSEKLPLARALYALVDKDASGQAPLSAAVAGVHGVICGTPIGVLSFEPVKTADPGSFDLLIVDEVSKMTLPEFLAIAVKARRWVLVGDPEQLPPYNNAEENGTTFEDIISPLLELVCSVGAVLERIHPASRYGHRLVVVSSAPERALGAIRAHLDAVGLENVPPITLHDGGAHHAGIVVCTPAQTEAAAVYLSPVRGRDRTHNPGQPGTVSILVERGIRVDRPAFASGTRLVEPRLRAPALIFENAFAVYHAQPWTVRASQKLRLVGFRRGIDKYLPSDAAIVSLHGLGGSRAALINEIAERFAVNAVSVYDWLTGIAIDHFDTSPLRELEGVAGPLVPLREAVRPFVGTLKKQYRMHASLSRVPRELFYFGEALEDGAPDAKPGCRVRLVQVETPGQAGEANDSEVKSIGEMLKKLNATDAAERHRPNILVITPYRAQEQRISEMIGDLRSTQKVQHLNVEACTLDRCQGREAEYVFISLVRGRATPFLDAPKRWNVALTRAMQGLFIFGDIDRYLGEANEARARSEGGRPCMSLLARILEAYDLQLAGRPSHV